MNAWNSTLLRTSAAMLLALPPFMTSAQDCKYYEHEKRKERLCQKEATRWLKTNHELYGFEPRLPLHRFQLDYDESNEGDLRVYCDYKRGRLDEEDTVSADSASSLEQRLDQELAYRLSLLEKKVPWSEHHWMFELYQGLEWHVIEFYFDINTLRLLRVEYVTDAYERKVIRISQ